MKYDRITAFVIFAAPIFAGPVWAMEDRLTEGEFAALVDGKTLFFSQRGQDYGAEEYRRDRSVIWSFQQGQCLRGVWEPGPDNSICFIYQDRPDAPICWAFFRDGEDISARVLDADPANDLTVTGESTAPLICPGPDVGV